MNLGGHVEVGDQANIGGMVAVHQFSKIGKHSMIGGGVIIRKDVPPFVKVGRDPASYIGVNSIGLKRRGFEQESIDRITDIYRILFVKHRNQRKEVEVINITIPDSSYKLDVLDFIEHSNRGLIKGIQ